jgi:tryptophan-rich sensory protein
MPAGQRFPAARGGNFFCDAAFRFASQLLRSTILTTHSDLHEAFPEHHPNLPAQAIGLIAFAVICFAAAGLGSLATFPNLPTWYAGLEKPFFTPPNEIFGPVWTILYALMAIAGWLAWRADAIEADRKTALTAFGVQLVLNVAWSWAFFGMQSTIAGLGVIVVLLAAILWTIAAFRLVSKLAAALMLPYLAWVAFATALNAGIYVLNG